MSLPSDAAFEHCNHGYAKPQHFHTDHIVTVLLNAGSNYKSPNEWSEYDLDFSSSGHLDRNSVDNLTWEASFIMNMGEPGTSPWTCLNSALTSSSLWT